MHSLLGSLPCLRTQKKRSQQRKYKKIQASTIEDNSHMADFNLVVSTWKISATIKDQTPVTSTSKLNKVNGIFLADAESKTFVAHEHVSLTGAFKASALVTVCWHDCWFNSWHDCGCFSDATATKGIRCQPILYVFHWHALGQRNTFYVDAHNHSFIAITKFGVLTVGKRINGWG